MAEKVKLAMIASIKGRGCSTNPPKKKKKENKHHLRTENEKNTASHELFSIEKGK